MFSMMRQVVFYQPVRQDLIQLTQFFPDGIVERNAEISGRGADILSPPAVNGEFT